MLPKPMTQLLEKEKVLYEVMLHPRAFTAQAVAASLHVSGRDFAKPVIVKTLEGRMLMAVVPGPRHVDLRALSGLLGVPVELAREEELEPLFPDCEVGAEPPFGNLYGMQVFVDAALSSDPEIVFNAGSHSEAVRMRFEDYARLVHPAVARISLGGH